MAKDDKKINRYLDNYYVDDDSPQIVGEIFLKQPDTGFLPKDKSMDKQSKKLYSAINKIYGAYLASESKDAFKKQFDIYPLRDFDLYMNSLGAKRVPGGKDFIGVGETTDWVALIKEEREKRVAVYNTREKEIQEEKEKTQDVLAEKKIDENIQKDRKEAGKTINNIFEEIISGSNTSFNKYKENNNLGFDYKLELRELQKLAVNNPESFKEKFQEKIKFDPLKTRKETLIFDIEKLLESKVNIKTSNILTSTEIKAQEEKLEEQKKAKTESNIYTKDNTQSKTEELDEKIKSMKLSRKEMKGNFIEEKQQKQTTQRMNIWENEMLIQTDGDAINPYDGFSTQGPFCIQKRHYFANVFRKSMQHHDTEDREVGYATYSGQDEGNDIVEVNQNIVASPLTAPVTSENVLNSLSDIDKDPKLTEKEKQNKKIQIAINQEEKIIKILQTFFQNWDSIEFIVNWWSREEVRNEQDSAYIKFCREFIKTFISIQYFINGDIKNKNEFVETSRARIRLFFQTFNSPIKVTMFLGNFCVFCDLNKNSREYIGEYASQILQISRFIYGERLDNYYKHLRMNVLKLDAYDTKMSSILFNKNTDYPPLPNYFQ